MARYSKDYYRSQALARRRDPQQDIRNAEAMAAVAARVAAQLEVCPVNQRLNEVARSKAGTC